MFLTSGDRKGVWSGSNVLCPLVDVTGDLDMPTPKREIFQAPLFLLRPTFPNYGGQQGACGGPA
jgi:hypothetical protein